MCFPQDLLFPLFLSQKSPFHVVVRVLCPIPFNPLPIHQLLPPGPLPTTLTGIFCSMNLVSYVAHVCCRSVSHDWCCPSNSFNLRTFANVIFSTVPFLSLPSFVYRKICSRSLPSRFSWLLSYAVKNVLFSFPSLSFECLSVYFPTTMGFCEIYWHLLHCTLGLLYSLSQHRGLLCSCSSKTHYHPIHIINLISVPLRFYFHQGACLFLTG